MDRVGEPKVLTLAVSRESANRLKVVAAHRDLTMQEAFEKYLRPVIDREYRKAVDAANAEFGGSD